MSGAGARDSGRAAAAAEAHRRVVSAIHASEGASAATAESVEAAGGSLAALLTRHVLRDGELVLLTLRPSLWFIPLSSLRFISVVLLFMLAGRVFDEQLPYSARFYIEAGVFLIAGRLMWALVQWMGRLYVLTDLRILAISGVFAAHVFECALRKVARTRLVYTMRERLLGLGSLEIIPQDDEAPVGLWQMIGRPRRVHERVLSAIRRARQGGMGHRGE